MIAQCRKLLIETLFLLVGQKDISRNMRSSCNCIYSLQRQILSMIATSTSGKQFRVASEPEVVLDRIRPNHPAAVWCCTSPAQFSAHLDSSSQTDHVPPRCLGVLYQLAQSALQLQPRPDVQPALLALLGRVVVKCHLENIWFQFWRRHRCQYDRSA